MSINLSNIKSENFCIAPWVNIHVGLQGAIKPCCRGASNFGSLNDDLWKYTNSNNTELLNLKSELLNGTKPSYCNNCEEKTWYNDFVKTPTPIIEPSDFLIKSVDARWGTTCQLSCTYCNDFNSSTWAQLVAKNKKVIPVTSRQFKNQVPSLLEFIKNNRNSIERVSLVGGEPLLLNENIELLDIITDSTKIEIITNLSGNLDNNKIYQKLINRSNVNWYVSMENIGTRFEFVRRGAAWDNQVQNLKKLLKDLDATSTLRLQSQYCVYSALNLLELYQFAKELGVEVNLSLALIRPKILNIFSYPDTFKQQAISEINSVIQTTDNLSYTELDQLSRTKEKLETALGTESPQILEQCVEWHRTQEATYFDNQFNFLDLWPQFLT